MKTRGNNISHLNFSAFWVRKFFKAPTVYLRRAGSLPRTACTGAVSRFSVVVSVLGRDVLRPSKRATRFSLERTDFRTSEYHVRFWAYSYNSIRYYLQVLVQCETPYATLYAILLHTYIQQFGYYLETKIVKWAATKRILLLLLVTIYNHSCHDSVMSRYYSPTVIKN